MAFINIPGAVHYNSARALVSRFDEDVCAFSSHLTGKIHERVKEYTSRLHKNNLIDYETFKYLSSNNDPKSGRFYILPKIHKQGNPGKPIVSSNSHPTERISEFVDYHLKPLVQILPSHIKDTTHFLLKLQELGPLPDNALLVTLDVSSLYTNIPHNEGIEACRHFLNYRLDKSLPTEHICDLIRMILTINNFSFNNEHSINDVHLIPLELMRSSRDSVRKAREAHLINKAKTLHPLGINRRDEAHQ